MEINPRGYPSGQGWLWWAHTALPVLPAVLRFGGWHHFSQLLGLRLPGGVSGVGWLMLVGWRELARKERHGETCAAYF